MTMCYLCKRSINPADWWMAHRPTHRECFLRAVNQIRAENGQSPLTWDEFLADREHVAPP